MKLTKEEKIKLENFAKVKEDKAEIMLNAFPFFRDFMNSVKNTTPILDKRDIINQNLIKTSPTNFNIFHYKNNKKI